MMATAYIGMGSNVGDKEKNISDALKLLKTQPEIKVRKTAPLYRSAPVGYTEQDWFLNTVIEVETTLSPDKLLQKLLQTEKRLGRVRTIRWGPRTLDLDLLLYGNSTINTADLVIPHPRMLERAFVIVPLADLNPNLVLANGKTAKELAAELLLTQQIYQ